MKIELTPDLKIAYPEATFGCLIVRNVSNAKKHDVLEDCKRELEKRLREFADVEKDSVIQSYRKYFKKWDKTYPIEFQIKTIKSGGRLPHVSVLVDSMFLAELKNRFLTSGHDLDVIQGDLTFNVSKGGERYVKINGEEQELKENDVILKDEVGILASILYGPSKRTAITLETKNAIYFGWFPYGMSEDLINIHLKDIISNLGMVFESMIPEIQIHR